MRSLAFLSGGLFLFAAGQTPLPAPLARHYASLAAAPSLTVVYTVQPIGEAKANYKLVFSKPGAFRFTTPTGYVVSDGKTVTTYKNATKSYTEEPYSPAWAAAFAKRPEVFAWGAFLLKEPTAEIAAARVGASRKLGTFETTEVEVTPKKGEPTTLFLDKKLGVARGLLFKGEKGEVIVNATTLEIGKEPAPADTFAFVAPEGSKKEEAVTAVTFAEVNTLIQDRCVGCHGATGARAGISLHNYDAIMKTVVPGDPKGSLLFKAIKGDGVRKMPLGNHPAYSDAETKQLEAWIAAGAKP